MANEHRLRIERFTTMADGTEAVLHIHEIIGDGGAGPTVGVSAAVHGNGNTSAQIVRTLWPILQRATLKGRIVLLPVANPRAMAMNRRFTPVDELNLNRQFPGDPSGWHTEQLAAAITREFLEKIDVHIDLHAGTDRPTVDYVYILNAEPLSRAFGSRVLYRPETGVTGTTFTGTTKDVTIDRRGIPSVVVELGCSTSCGPPVPWKETRTHRLRRSSCGASRRSGQPGVDGSKPRRLRWVSASLEVRSWAG